MPTDFDDFHISRRINSWVGPDNTDTDYEGSHPELRILPRADEEKAWKKFLEQWDKWVRLQPLTLGVSTNRELGNESESHQLETQQKGIVMTQQQMIEKIVELGFEIIQTGGGCTAYHLNISEDKFIWITDSDGSSHPFTSQDENDISICMYERFNDGDEFLFKIKFEELEKYVNYDLWKAKEIYKKHGLTFHVDPNGYPYTMWADDPSRDDDFEEVFSEEEFNETSWAFAILADEAEKT